MTLFDNISDELLDLTEDIYQEMLICVESNEEDENSLDSYLLNSEDQKKSKLFWVKGRSQTQYSKTDILKRQLFHNFFKWPVWV